MTSGRRTERCYLNHMAMVNAIGGNNRDIWRNALAGLAPGMTHMTSARNEARHFAGRVLEELPPIPERFARYRSRNSQFCLYLLEQLGDALRTLTARYPASRIAVVMGSSTSGVAETEEALQYRQQHGTLPETYHYAMQALGTVSAFIAEYLGLEGPAMTISTACSSSGKAFATARGLLENGLCDAVIVGGADSLCDLTLQGFTSLEAVSRDRCNPFSVNRNGINIGEGGCLFIMSREPGPVYLAGVGESSDAYHMSSPDPSGAGAARAMQAALDDAGLTRDSVGYVNLHATATRLNDQMESIAVQEVLGDAVWASGTKPLTGHTLGAAGAIEAGLCWLLLHEAQEGSRLLPHLYDGAYDPGLSRLKLCTAECPVAHVKFAMSNSFAFGGSNVSLLLGREGRGSTG